MTLLPLPETEFGCSPSGMEETAAVTIIITTAVKQNTLVQVILNQQVSSVSVLCRLDVGNAAECITASPFIHEVPP